MKLISEEINNAEYIVEEKDNGKKDYKIKGIFLQSDIKNRNGRVYPKEVLMKEVKRYNQEFINKKRAFGELGHPDGPTVNLERVSHMITKLYPEDRNFIGEAKIMNTPSWNSRTTWNSCRSKGNGGGTLDSLRLLKSSRLRSS